MKNLTFYFDEQTRRIRQVHFGSLAGTTVGEVLMSETFRDDNPAPKVTLGPEEKGFVTVTLKSDYKIFGSKFHAEGKLEAIVCEK